MGRLYLEKKLSRSERKLARRIDREGSYINGAAFPRKRRGYSRTHIINVSENGVLSDRVKMVRNIDAGGVSPNIILRCVLLFLIVVALFNFANGNDTFVSFTSFLELLQNAPKLDISWINGVSINLGDWGIFNVFRNFVDILISIVRMGLYLAVGVGQIIVFVGYFFSAFFSV